MTYASLLNQVASSDPITRIQWVAAFAVSSISPNLGRMSKPFNPLLGIALTIYYIEYFDFYGCF